VAFGFPIFKELAEKLGENGIRVFRYDDLEGSVDESAEAVVQIVDFFGEGRIGLLGHSEGGKTALIAAEKSKEVDFVITMGGSMMKVDEIILLQQRIILEKEGELSQEVIDESLRLRKDIYDKLKQGRDIEDEIRAFVLFEFSLLSQEEQDEITQEQLNQGVNDFVSYLEAEPFQFLLTYDPLSSVRNLGIPILAIYGEKDVQVPATENIRLLNFESVSIIIIEDGNHLFQSADSGLPSEYSTLEKAFAPGFIEGIVGWLG